MDVAQIQARLDALKNGAGKDKKEKIDYTKIFWKPTVGKHQIRIVPSKYNEKNPFTEVYLHYGIAKFPIVALNNFGEPDPIIDFAEELRKTREKDNYALAKKISPKMRVYAPVIVRGEEDKGVRLWEFGKKIYEEFLGYAVDEDYLDYEKVANGRDFTVEGFSDEVAGRKVVSCTVRPKPKNTALSTDKKQVELWLSEQPNIFEVNKKLTYDEIKVYLEKFMEPPTESTPATPPTTESTPDPVKTDVTSEFDKLFEK